MGGEDWEMWIDALKAENLLAEGASTVAFSYIGPAVTEPSTGKEQSAVRKTIWKKRLLPSPIN
jgi:trans-2-enoyl-CoA reductase